MPIHCVRNRIFPSRYYPDPRLSLYALPFNDGEGGKLRNHITGEDATLTGGSTLLAQEKFRNDFQRLTSTFPSLGYRASGEVTNLLYALNPDNTSFENGTVGGWEAARHTAAIITTDAWHGSRCYQATINDAGGVAYAREDIKAATAAGAQYTLVSFLKAGNAAAVGKQYRNFMMGDTSGATYGNTITLSTSWQMSVCTKTFAAGDTTTRVADMFQGLAAGAVGDIILCDAVVLVAGATVPQFEEAECVATSCTFPTPFAVGEAFSFLVLLNTPYDGTSTSNRMIFDDQYDANNRIYLTRAPGQLALVVAAPGGATNRDISTNATNWPIGFNAIAGSIDASANLVLALNGTASTQTSVAGRETNLTGTMMIGRVKNVATNYLNGLILPFFYRGVAWGGAECEYYSTLQAPPPMYRRVG